MNRMLRAGLVGVLVGLGPAGCSAAHLTRPAAAKDTTGIVDGHCPPTAPVSKIRTDSGSGKLVPIAARKMVLCRYNGMNEVPHGGLHTARVITDKAAVERWRDRFNALPAVIPGPRSCPPGDDRVLRIAFVASSSSFVVLTTDLSGCGFVSGTGGVREVNSRSDLTFRTELARLAGD